MALTTGGTTYVTSTDLVANYPTASLALANRVDVVASGGPNSIKTAGYTITLADILGGNKFLYNSASPGTFTLPTSGLVDGMTVNVAQIGAGALTVSGGTIVGTTVTTAQYQGLRFVYASTGTTWYSVAPSATAPGLATATPTSIANSGGSATLVGGLVTFTSVTSISLNGVFNSTYENYYLSALVSQNASSNVLLRLRVSGTDSSVSYDVSNTLIRTGGTAIAGATGNGTGQSSFISQFNTASFNNFMNAQVFRPFTAFPTTYFGKSISNDGTGQFSLTTDGVHQVSTAYDGLSLIAAAGTLSGNIRVYGYKNS